MFPKNRYMTDLPHYELHFLARQCVSSRDIEAASVTPAAAGKRGRARAREGHVRPHSRGRPVLAVRQSAGSCAVVPEVLLVAEPLTQNSTDVDSYRPGAGIGQDGDKRCRMQVQHPPLTRATVTVDLDRPLRQAEFRGE